MTTVSGVITRSELSLSDLTICDGVRDLRIDAFDAGTVAPRYEWQTSDWVHGAQDSGSGALDLATITAVWLVQGSSHSNLNSVLTGLVKALRQSTFELSLQFDSQESRWSCRRASIQQPLTAVRELHYLAELTTLIPRHPIPLAGPF